MTDMMKSMVDMIAVCQLYMLIQTQIHLQVLDLDQAPGQHPNLSVYREVDVNLKLNPNLRLHVDQHLPSNSDPY